MKDKRNLEGAMRILEALSGAEEELLERSEGTAQDSQVLPQGLGGRAGPGCCGRPELGRISVDFKGQ